MRKFLLCTLLSVAGLAATTAQATEVTFTTDEGYNFRNLLIYEKGTDTPVNGSSSWEPTVTLDLEPGTYSVEAALADLSYNEIPSGALKTFTVGNTPTTVNYSIAENYAKVRFTLTNEAGQPMEGVYISNEAESYSVDSYYYSFSVTTGADGTAEAWATPGKTYTASTSENTGHYIGLTKEFSTSSDEVEVVLSYAGYHRVDVTFAGYYSPAEEPGVLYGGEFTLILPGGGNFYLPIDNQTAAAYVVVPDGEYLYTANAPFDADNTAYTAEGNVLYNKDKTTLHTWPAGIPYVEVYTLPETVTGIESNAFRNAKIGYLVLHDGMKTGSVPYGLSVCRHIQGVTLPSNATALMTSALQNAPLRSLTLPSSITSLSYSSLAYLAYLDHLISLPTTPPTAQSSTFTSTAKRVYVPSGSVSAYQAANYWKDFEITGIVANGTCGDGLTWILGADSTLIISGYGAMDNYSATSIPWLANRAGIKQVVVEDFVTSIGDYAFYNMPNLSSADLGERILTIGANAFANCSGLTEITIPANVAAIGADAFAQTGITAITALPTTPPSIEENTFAGVPADIDLTVPAESVEAYGRAMGWSAFGNHTSILGRGVCGLKAEWQLTDDGIMRVYGSGTMSNYSNNGMPWRDLRDQIRTLVVEEDISMIGYYAIFVVCTRYLTEDFGTSAATAGLATGIVVIGCLVGRFFTGSIIRDVGYRRVLGIGVFFFFLMNVAYFFLASNFEASITFEA